MARKLRLFKEQMAKAGISHSEMAMTQTRIDFDEMEVNMLTIKCYLFLFFRLTCKFYPLH